MQQKQGNITLVTGGSRSGKSSHALELAEQYKHKVFIATAQAMDDEMRSRIQKHREERGESFRTIEEPLDIADAVSSVTDTDGVIVLDCLTVWLGNLLYHLQTEEERKKTIDGFLKVLESPPCDIIIVTNEVGMGIVPENELSRDFRDQAGFLNQQVAKLADTVAFIVSGIPMTLK
jgi:adenosylcobinamide kinase/adenosylcobinamide-phosphate guanylyltransferase